MIVNEFVSKSNESITNLKYLKYPSLEIVKELNKYNRANTPDTNIFYCSENIDTCLREIRPPINKLISVGVWKPKDENNPIISFPITHDELAGSINEGMKNATQAFENYKGKTNENLLVLMRNYFQILGREYTKKINHNFDYFISAIFSERIFRNRNELVGFKYDCIIYPSVGNDYITDNLAIYPDSLDKNFYLDRVIEFEVTEQMYDNKFEFHHPDLVTLAKISKHRTTKKIYDDGRIEW